MCVTVYREVDELRKLRAACLVYVYSVQSLIVSEVNFWHIGRGTHRLQTNPADRVEANEAKIDCTSHDVHDLLNSTSTQLFSGSQQLHQPLLLADPISRVKMDTVVVSKGLCRKDFNPLSLPD